MAEAQSKSSPAARSGKERPNSFVNGDAASIRLNEIESIAQVVLKPFKQEEETRVDLQRIVEGLGGQIQFDESRAPNLEALARVEAFSDFRFRVHLPKLPSGDLRRSMCAFLFARYLLEFVRPRLMKDEKPDLVRRSKPIGDEETPLWSKNMGGTIDQDEVNAYYLSRAILAPSEVVKRYFDIFGGDPDRLSALFGLDSFDLRARCKALGLTHREVVKA